MSNLAYVTHYTYEDYKQWEGDWELIGGQAVALAPSHFGVHQGILSEIVYDLKSSLEKYQKEWFVYAELDYVIDEETVLRPDILLSCQKIKKYAKKAPEMVVEVISPMTALKDQNIKFTLYERERVPIYMMVDPNVQKVRVFALTNGKYQKVVEETEGSLQLKIDERIVTLQLDRWWKVL